MSVSFMECIYTKVKGRWHSYHVLVVFSAPYKTPTFLGTVIAMYLDHGVYVQFLTCIFTVYILSRVKLGCKTIQSNPVSWWIDALDRVITPNLPARNAPGAHLAHVHYNFSTQSYRGRRIGCRWQRHGAEAKVSIPPPAEAIDQGIMGTGWKGYGEV